MSRDNFKGRNFYGVALALILVGAAFFSIGSVAWIVNCYFDTSIISIPSMKIIGGLIVMALGYVVLILEATRNK